MKPDSHMHQNGSPCRQRRQACLWAGMLHLVPTSRQSGAPSSTVSRPMAALSSPSRLAATLLLREDDGEAEHTSNLSESSRLVHNSAWGNLDASTAISTEESSCS